MVDFGVCDCGGSLIPVWFTEEETKVANGTMYKTGRCVDDTFDGPWHNRR